LYDQAQFTNISVFHIIEERQNLFVKTVSVQFLEVDRICSFINLGIKKICCWYILAVADLEGAQGACHPFHPKFIHF
jgi:hypothetical protein